MIMAISRSYPLGTVRIIITLLIIFSIFSVWSSSSSSSYRSDRTSGVVVQLAEGKKVLGSRPPACVNKCLGCRPCMATLIIPPHQIKKTTIHNQREDDSYYLLSWKCRCGDKIFQP